LKIFFPEVTVAKPRSSRNSSIGIFVIIAVKLTELLYIYYYNVVIDF